MPELLESEFMIKSNDIFHFISNKITKETGIPRSKIVFAEFEKWLREEIKLRKE